MHSCYLHASLEILKTYLTKCWFIVQSRASIAMTARTNLEVEGTVNSANVIVRFK
jgi:hypothetical protein